jgi:hypothetical protein
MTNLSPDPWMRPDVETFSELVPDFRVHDISDFNYVHCSDIPEID